MHILPQVQARWEQPPLRSQPVRPSYWLPPRYPCVAAQADAKVDHADLTALLYFQGYKADSFFKVEMGR